METGMGAVTGMGVPTLAHLREDVRGEIERQREGRPKLLAN